MLTAMALTSPSWIARSYLPRLPRRLRHRIRHVEARYSDPAVAAFVLIPALLASALVWGTRFAWRRSGASDAEAIRASLAVGAATAAWMAATWLAARSGIL